MGRNGVVEMEEKIMASTPVSVGWKNGEAVVRVKLTPSSAKYYRLAPILDKLAEMGILQEIGEDCRS